MSLIQFYDPNDAVFYWNKTFLIIADCHAPLVKRRVKKQNQPPWMTSDIHKAIHDRDKLLNKVKQSSDPNDWNVYKRARNLTFRTIREAKSKFFHSSFENSSSPKQFWKYLKKVIGSVKKPQLSKIRVNGSVIHDPITIANSSPPLHPHIEQTRELRRHQTLRF